MEKDQKKEISRRDFMKTTILGVGGLIGLPAIASPSSHALTGLRTLAPLLLLWLGAQQVLAGNMTLGSMLAVNALALLFLTPLGSLVSSGRELQFIGAHLERLADVLEAEPEQSVGSGEQLAALQGNIELSTMTFGYRPEEPILHEISLSEQEGQKYAGHVAAGALFSGCWQHTI